MQFTGETVAVFDYAFEGPTGLQRISRARAKGAVMRGELGPGESVVVTRRAPPERRRFTLDELRSHFELLANGGEDPFDHVSGEVLAAADGGVAPAAAAPAAPIPSAPAAPKPVEPAAAIVEPQPAVPSAPTPEPVETPEAPPVDAPPPVSSSALSAEPQRARPTEPSSASAAAPASSVAEAEAAPAAAPQRDVIARSAPARAKPLERELPGAGAPLSRPSQSLQTRPAVRSVGELGGWSQVRRLRMMLAVGAGVVAAVVVVLGGLWWWRGIETIEPLYAQDTLIVHAAPQRTAVEIGQIDKGFPVLALVSGGDQPPPSGWVRVVEPAAAMGGYVPRDALAAAALPEVIATSYAGADARVLRSVREAESVMTILTPGEPVRAIVEGGESPPPAGWARILAPDAAAGGYAALDALRREPLPERRIAVFAQSDAPAYAAPNAQGAATHTFSEGEAVELVVAGGSAPPPGEWGRVVAPQAQAGLFVARSAFTASPLPQEQNLFYADAQTTLLQGADDPDGLALNAGAALEVVVSGGDNPPPEGFGRVVGPAAYAGRLVALASLSRTPAAQTVETAYASTALEALPTPPLTLWTGSVDGALEPVTIGRGEALDLVVRGGAAPPPQGWAQVVTPERAADRWVRVADLAPRPVAEESGVYYALVRADITSAPDAAAPVTAQLPRGARVRAVSSGGAAAPPAGWARLVEPDVLAGGFMASSVLSTTPLPEDRTTLFALSAADVFSTPDVTGASTGIVPRGAAVTAVRGGGERPPPEGWVRLPASDAAPAGFAQAALFATEARPDMDALVQALWTAEESTPIYAAPRTSAAQTGTLGAGESIFVVGAISSDWVEVRRGRGVVGYAPLQSFEQAAEFGVPELQALINQTWWTTESGRVYERPNLETDVIAVLEPEQPLQVRGRVDRQWVELVLAEGRGYALSATLSPTPPPVITPPSVIRAPSSDMVNRRYPRRAYNAGASGSVVLGCTVALNGRGTCTVLQETPTDLGFGDAAVSLSSSFRFSPRLEDGVPVDGGYVQVGLQFVVSDN